LGATVLIPNSGTGIDILGWGVSHCLTSSISWSILIGRTGVEMCGMH